MMVDPGQGLVDYLVGILYLLHRNSYRREVREELYRAVGKFLGGARIERLSEAVNAVGIICRNFSSCVELWFHVVNVLKRLGVDAMNQLDEIDKFRDRIEEDYVLAMLHMFEPGYPRRLRHVDPPAPIIFVRAQHRDVTLDDALVDIKWMLNARPLIAIIGTREPSKKGCEVAREVARYMAGLGFSMVTGLARGIDTCAAEGYLEGLLSYKNAWNPVLIGVRPYLEPFHTSLTYEAKQVIDKFRSHGVHSWVVISENASMYYRDSWVKSQLCLRNRLIASLADAIVVVEARAGEDDKLSICGSTSMIELGLRRGKRVYIWKTSSRNDEILRGHKLYVENGAVEFRDFKELYGRLLNDEATSHKIGNQRVVLYKPSLSSIEDLWFRDLWKEAAKDPSFLNRGRINGVSVYAPGVYVPGDSESGSPRNFNLKKLVRIIKGYSNKRVNPEYIGLASYLLAYVFQVAEHFEGEVDAITYVPCHMDNMRIAPDGSKICHVEELAKALAWYVDKPVIRVAEKVKHEDLIMMGREERRAKVEEMYKPSDRVEIIYSPPGIEADIGKIRRLTVVDDVMTTGSTLRKIIEIARSRGYEVAWCLVVAKTVYIID